MVFRKATEEDLPEIVEMLADDELGMQREEYQSQLSETYKEAFKNIHTDVNQELMVVESEMREIIGTFQLSFIQYLTYKGGIRAQVEAVRVKRNQRNSGLGSIMLGWAIQRAKDRNAHVIQLTTDKLRPKAIKFYKCLGFQPTHVGMKLHFK